MAKNDGRAKSASGIAKARPRTGVPTRKTEDLVLPKRILGLNKLDRNLAHEGLQPPRTLLHTRLFRRNVAQDNERLVLALGHGIRNVLHGFPFTGLSGHEHVYVVHFQSQGLFAESRGSWHQRDFPEFEMRVSDYPQYVDTEFPP